MREKENRRGYTPVRSGNGRPGKRTTLRFGDPGMWKEMFSNSQPDTEEEEQGMADAYNRPEASRVEGDGPARVATDTARVNSFLDKGTEFDGKLAFEGAVRINGRFSGEIFSEGTLYVGESGEVNAEVQVSTAIISGMVTGDIVATDKVELQRSARLRGNIKTQVLKIEEGALFEGNCQMKLEKVPAHKTPRIEAPAPPPEPDQEGLELT